MNIHAHEAFIEAIENPPATRSEREVRKLDSILDQIAAEDADRARKRCLKILRGMLGEGGLRAFLNCPQPEHDDRTGMQLITANPVELLGRLEEIERGAE